MLISGVRSFRDFNSTLPPEKENVFIKLVRAGTDYSGQLQSE